MNKRILILIFFITIFSYNIKVEASNCTPEDKKILKEEARMLEIIPIIDNEENYYHAHQYSVQFNNFSDNFYIVDSFGNQFIKDYNYTPETKYGSYLPGTVHTFKVYGNMKGKCSFVQLASIRVTFDYYNDYYLSPLCEGIEEFELCRRNYSGTIKSDEWFEEQIKAYKKSLEKEEQQEEKDTLEKIKEIIKENPLIIIVPITIIFVLIIIIVIIIKKHNSKKIKIDLGIK